MHKYMHAQCMHAYIHTFVCIHFFLFVVVYTLLRTFFKSHAVFFCLFTRFIFHYTQAILWVLELDTLCSYFTGRRLYFVIKTNLYETTKETVIFMSRRMYGRHKCERLLPI